MLKFILCLVALMESSSLFAKCSEVSEAIRKSYASNFYQAFQLQCQGKSVSAFCQFRVAYEEAEKAGESIQRLLILEQLFVWYRTYGSASRLFSMSPTGYDQIIGEYKRPYSRRSSYRSEWGNSPEQAAIIREFMFGIAETIAGIFCVTVSAGAGTSIGIPLILDGPRRIYVTLNNVWALHERAMLDLKKWEESAQKVIGSD